MDEKKDAEMVDRDLETLLWGWLKYAFFGIPVQKLEVFLEENYKILTLIGVFGALSIYIKTIGREGGPLVEPFANLALVSGLSIVFISSLIIYKNLLLAMSNKFLALEDWCLYFFEIHFLVLFTIFFGMTLQFEVTVGWVIMSLLLGFSALGMFLSAILAKVPIIIGGRHDFDYPIPTIFLFSLIIVTYLYLLRNNSVINLGIFLYPFSISWFSLSISTFFFGLAFGSFISLGIVVWQKYIQ